MGKEKLSRGLEALATSVSVKLPNGTEVSITLHKFDQMSQVYSLVAHETSAQESLVRVKYSGKVLKKIQTTSSLGLMDGMVLKAEVSLMQTAASLVNTGWYV